MKRMLRILARACLAGAAGVATACISTADGAAAAEGGGPLALVAEVRGEVEVYLSDEDVWAPAEAGMDLFDGDRIRTGRGSSALLLLVSGETVRVPEKSSVDFSAPSGEHPSALSVMLRGLWEAVARKFVDAQDAEVASGLVGALRGPEEEGDLVDRELAPGERERLEQELGLLEEHPGRAAAWFMLQGILCERYHQYASAESAYLRAIELSPGEAYLYDMLMDLYLEAGARDRLERARRLKRKALSGG
jgi:hypothetical protein